jgi:hypothetical protein
MQELYIPTLHTFAMKNTFTGSCGNFRFKIEPVVVMATQKEVDFASSSINAKFWHGPFCFEKSEIEGEADFSMSEDGRLAMKSWLESNI